VSGFEIGLSSVGLLILLVYAGLHVPVAFILVSFFGVFLVRGSFDVAANSLVIAATDSISSYTFATVPVFVFMGLLVVLAGMGRSTFDVAAHATRRLPGGLAIGSVGANAIFAATIGVGIAAAAIFSKLAIPEMQRYGYSLRRSAGVVAAASLLGPLIPPSLLLILFGVMTFTSIGSLFLAAVIPGLLLAAAYVLFIVLEARFRPAIYGGTDADRPCGPAMTWREIILKIGPITVLVFLIFGGLYGGIFTANEAGAMGAFGALLFALFKVRNPKTYWRLLTETGQVTASILLLVIGASIYTRMLALTGVPAALVGLFSDLGLGVVGTLVIYVIIILLLGTLIDSASIILLVVPLMYPIFQSMNVDPIWLGIITVMSVEVGLLTPPFGMAAFVVKATSEQKELKVEDVYWGAAPFAIITIGVVGLLILFPQITTVLLR